MDGQLDFFGAGSDRRPQPAGSGRDEARYRWYFSIVPPPAEARRIEYGGSLLARRHGARNPIRAERLHVSLNAVWRGSDDIAPTLVAAALEVGRAISRPGFDIVFDTVQTFSGDSRSRTGGRSIVPTVLTCSNGAREVLALHADIRRQMQRLGMAAGPKSPTPHMTIWYGPERVPELTLRRAFRWPVRQFWLVHTVRGQPRPDYVAGWALG